ncbi:MAG TPA: hypothetical protein VF230_06960 [Acidimicrobiales bacterium]
MSVTPGTYPGAAVPQTQGTALGRLRRNSALALFPRDAKTVTVATGGMAESLEVGMGISARHARHRLLAFASAVALLGVTVFVGEADAGPDTAGPEPCVVPGDASLRAASRPTEAGHFPHEEWIAAAAPQRAVAEVNAALVAEFGQPTKEDPSRWLRAGLIGATVDHHTKRLVVVADGARVDTGALRGRLAAASDRADATARVAVGVQGGCFSASDLLDAQRVLDRRAWHPGAKRASYSFYLDASDSRFHITFSSSDAPVAEALGRVIGDRVVIDYGTPERRIGDRLADAGPHFASAGIGPSANNNDCTSTFTAILPGGARGSITADHCYGDAQDVWSGPHYYGRTQEVAGFPTWDMMRIAPNGQRFTSNIHVDPCCPSVRTVTGRGDPALNEYICHSGMVTRASCGIRVDNLSATMCTETHCTPGVMHAVKPGAVIGRPGDSGGTMYVRPTLTTAHIRGLHIGGATDDEIYAEHISQVESHLGVSVFTSGPVLGTNATLQVEDRLVSTDGRFHAVMQGDGNFVLYQNGVGALWSTGTQNNPGARIVMQGDGNLVVYRTNGTAAWASSTFGSGHALVMQTDGNLVMYRAAGGAVWASNTCCR